MFFIRIKIKGYLKNLTENTKEIIDINGIKNKNNISYVHNNTVYKITIIENKVTITRNNEEYSHTIVFKEKEVYESVYYLKNMHTNINIAIKTEKLIITDNKIEIVYQIIDSDIKYKYVIEMSDK